MDRHRAGRGRAGRRGRRRRRPSASGAPRSSGWCATWPTSSGNTPAVARGSYVDPRVIERFEEGRTVGDAVADDVVETVAASGWAASPSGGRARMRRPAAMSSSACRRACWPRSSSAVVDLIEGAHPAPRRRSASGSRRTAGRLPRWPAPRRADRDLADYDAKRDFGRTPEPAGAPPRSAGGPGRDLRRPAPSRPGACTTTCASRSTACWRAGPSPRARPSTRATRSLAVQVEDHPMEYADFEGVIPAGEYGGGDVIVWDRGTWSPARTDDPAAAIAGGELHFDLGGGEARRPVRPRAHGGRRPGPQPVAAAAQVRRGGRAGLAPRGPSPVGEVGPHQRRGARRARGAVAQRPARRPRPRSRWTRARATRERRPGRRRAAADGRVAGRARLALDALGPDGRWQVGGTGWPSRASTTSWRGPRARSRSPSATSSATTRRWRPGCCRTWPTGRRRCACSPRASLGRGADGGDLVARAPRWIRRWRDPRRRVGRDTRSSCWTGSPRLAWVVGERGFELRPSAAPADAPASPTLGGDRHRAGRRHRSRGPRTRRPAVRHRAAPPRARRWGAGGRDRRPRGVGPRRRRARRSPASRPGRPTWRGRSPPPCPTWSAANARHGRGAGGSASSCAGAAAARPSCPTAWSPGGTRRSLRPYGGMSSTMPTH